MADGDNMVVGTQNDAQSGTSLVVEFGDEVGKYGLDVLAFGRPAIGARTEDTNPDNSAIEAFATAGAGVFGHSSSNTGVAGVSGTGAGVVGFSDSSFWCARPEWQCRADSSSGGRTAVCQVRRSGKLRRGHRCAG